MRRLEPPFCEMCAQPIRTGNRCGRCRESPLTIDGIRAAFLIEGVVRDLIHRFKYSDIRALAPVVAGLLAECLKSTPLPCNVLMAVPIHRWKERRRGYNQSALLATELSKLTGIPLAKGLERIKDSPPQASSRSAEERQENVKDAFVFRGDPLEGKRMLLLDDVCTTGSTLDACARVLKHAGASNVWGFTLARES